METNKTFKEKFQDFKSGKLGRTIDITLGILLLAYTVFFEPYRIVAVIIGVFAFTAGAFNVCWAAPIIGIPFKGNSKLKK